MKGTGARFLQDCLCFEPFGPLSPLKAVGASSSVSMMNLTRRLRRLEKKGLGSMIMLNNDWTEFVTHILKYHKAPINAIKPTPPRTEPTTIPVVRLRAARCSDCKICVGIEVTLTGT